MTELFRSRRWLAALLAAPCLLLATPSMAGGADVTGVWVSQDGKGAVEISACGDKRCGSIVWVKDPLDAKGQPLLDGNNASEALRTRPICGLPILMDLAQTNGAWDGGKIYDPEEGKTYAVKMKLLEDGKLEVTGYEAVPLLSETEAINLLSETQTWTKAPADLARCKA
jgi:uncharacterized protein (DUF2147 family)